MPPIETPDELRARAFDLLMRNDTAGGITDLKSYLAQEPDDAGAWLAVGTAYAAIQHLPQAKESLQRAVDLDGESVDARLAFAQVLTRLGKLDDAALQLLQASKVAPENARVLHDLGLVFYDKRLYDEAIAWLTKATAADPADARAHFALGLAFEAERDVGAALASYREAVRRDPSSVDARLTLADTLAGMGEHQAALRELDALLAPRPAGKAPSPAVLEQAAHNREVLAHALDAMKKQRLLTKSVKHLEASALLTEGAFRKKGPVAETSGHPAGAQTVRYTAPLVEMYATLDVSDALVSALLVLTDPDRAARAEDEVFKVTVLNDAGLRTPANFATAITLTYLRELLGCPLTQASALYARLLGGEAGVEWGGAVVAFDSVPRPDKPADRRHGVRVRLS